MSREPKQPVTEIIPPAFRKFMQQVAKRIAAGDSATTLESDDLLQCDYAYGGLHDAAAKRFGFDYFRDDGVERDEDDQIIWGFDLDADQIQAIAAGKLKRIQLWRCADESCGNRFATKDSYCPECDFEGGGRQ